MGVLLWQTLSQNLQNTRSLLGQNELLMLDLMAEISRSALLTDEFDFIQPLAEQFQDHPNVIRTLISDHRNIIVAAGDFSELGKPLGKLRDGSDRYWQINEIKNPSGKLGTVAIEFSIQALQDSTNAAIRLSSVISLIGMSLIAIISLGFGSLLTRRLNLVADSAKMIANGQYKQRLNFHGKDEVSVVAQAVDNMAGQIAAHLHAQARINEELERRVIERTQELSTSLEEHKAFSYSLSHDLRSPLRAICGFSQILQEDYANKIDEEGQEHLQRIQLATNRLDNIINAMLTLSKISREELYRHEIDITHLVNTCVDFLQSKNIHRHVDVHVESHMTITGDSALLKIVFEKLLGNAWKFTETTTDVQISVGRYQLNEDIIFFIRDNGIGFDQNYADKLFMPFERLHGAGEYEGLGISLAMTKRIIDRHNGRIWGKGRSGKGATFYFTLQNKEKSHAVHEPLV